MPSRPGRTASLRSRQNFVVLAAVNDNVMVEMFLEQLAA